MPWPSQGFADWGTLYEGTNTGPEWQRSLNANERGEEKDANKGGPVWSGPSSVAAEQRYHLPAP